MNIGDIIKTQAQLDEAIKFCSEHQDCKIITLSNGDLMIEKDSNKSKEELLVKMEKETGLTREIRELFLNNDLKASEYVIKKVNEMESLALELRPKIEVDEIELPEEDESED